MVKQSIRVYFAALGLLLLKNRTVNIINKDKLSLGAKLLTNKEVNLKEKGIKKMVKKRESL